MTGRDLEFSPPLAQLELRAGRKTYETRRKAKELVLLAIVFACCMPYSTKVGV